MVIALFVALIGPWFVNWDDYKTNFEAQAERILGQPVRVVGSADASVLPSPSLTFTNVEVGADDGRPMMTVDRFAVTIELMPLLQGQIRVVSMKLERPVVSVAIDDSGLANWLNRTETSKAPDPDKVVLENVEIIDGTVVYADAGTGLDRTFAHINAIVDARSIAGPWRIEGSYQDDGGPVSFQFGTGRRLDNGSIRVKADITPAQVPLAIAADGLVQLNQSELNYAGTYSLTQIIAATEGGEPGDTAGWRSEGTFTLTRDRVVIDRAILSEGPPDRPSSLAGALIIEFGRDARFSATAEARQLDLDRSLGNGPAEPVEVGRATALMVDWLSDIPVPAIPGRIEVNVPVIVVGGAVIQDVSFVAAPEDGGWQISGLHGRLPGQAIVDAAGTLSTGERPGFGGVVDLTVGQPATFAAWWRGHSEPSAGRLLSSFALSGRTTINLEGITVDDMEASIDRATIRGGFSWSSSNDAGARRLLRTNLSADRLDFSQMKALAELLAGRDLADVGSVADSYDIRIVADQFIVDDVSMYDVEVDASFVDGALTVSGIDVGDIGGAQFKATRGQIDDVLTAPRGHLESQLTAPTVTGLARVVDRVIPDTAFSRWLNRAAPSLAPLTLTVEVHSPASEGPPTSQVKVNGSAAETQFDATAELVGAPANWRLSEMDLHASLKSHDALGLARQTGFNVASIPISGGARLDFGAEGVPEQGLAVSLKGGFGGLELDSEGRLILASDLPPRYDGSFGLEAADLDPFLAMTGLAIPGAALGTSARIDGTASTLGLTLEAEWTRGNVAGGLVSGKLRLSEGDNGAPRIDGDLKVDEMDLGWIASLGLGFAPLPTDDPAMPWSRTPFSDPVLGQLSGALAVTAERLQVSDHLQVVDSDFSLSFAPNRIDLNLSSGGVVGGKAAGGFSIRNVGGNANVTGRLNIVDASLGSVIWQRGGRAVATGSLDLSTDFEATGQSPAGLISSLTGGGTIAVHDGEARYVNPQAVSLVIRSADLGQQYTEDALQDEFADYIDGGVLKFAEVEGAFAIAAGNVRLQNMAVETAEARAIGGATVDLNTMTLDSDWTLTLDAGNVEETVPPQIGMVFRGPLAAPTRIIDVLQFSSYLNIRQEERLQEILANEEASRLERERFNREKRKLQEDAARTERLAREAREARVAQAQRLEEMHLARQVLTEERAAAQLVAAHAAAEEAAAEKAAAEQVAIETSAVADDARVKAEETAAAMAAAGEALDAAARAADEATRARVAADEAAGRAADRAAAARAAADVASAHATELADLVEEAEAMLTAAVETREKAVAEAGAAAAQVEAAGAAVDDTIGVHQDAVGESEEAARIAAERDQAVEAARSAANELAAALSQAEAEATVKRQVAAEAEEEVARAGAAQEEANQAAAVAADFAERASKDKAAAEAALGEKRRDPAATTADIATAQADLNRAVEALESAEIEVSRAQRAAAVGEMTSSFSATAAQKTSADADSAEAGANRLRAAYEVAAGKLADAEAVAATANDEAETAAAKDQDLAEQVETARAAGDATRAALTAAESMADEARTSEKAAENTLRELKEEHESAVVAADAAADDAEIAAGQAETTAATAEAAAEEETAALEQVDTLAAAKAEAEAAATEAAAHAMEAEAAAREAADTAASLPRVWLPDDGTEAKSGTQQDRRATDATSAGDGTVPVPAENASLSPIEPAPVIPRPKPERRVVLPEIIPILPTNDRPMILTPTLQ